VTIEEPEPADRTPSARGPGEGRGDLRPHGGRLDHRPRVYFDCTTGGEAQLGQLWELRPARGRRPAAARLRVDLRRRPREPDNIVIVPGHGPRLPAGGLRRRAVRARGDPARRHLRLREDAGQRVGVLRRVLQPDGKTFFLNQQGGRLEPGRPRRRSPTAPGGSPTRSGVRSRRTTGGRSHTARK
jgi:hypothetical protein